MLNRLMRIVLLSAVAFWAIGMATYLHERIEHAEVASSSTSEHHLASVTHQPQPSHGHDPSDHDDCPTCQLLAHMSVTSAAAPAALPVGFPPAAAAPIADWRPPVVVARLCATIRGPPVLVK